MEKMCQMSLTAVLRREAPLKGMLVMSIEVPGSFCLSLLDPFIIKMTQLWAVTAVILLLKMILRKAGPKQVDITQVGLKSGESWDHKQKGCRSL